jgi:hypothetical protein
MIVKRFFGYVTQKNQSRAGLEIERKETIKDIYQQIFNKGGGKFDFASRF